MNRCLTPTKVYLTVNRVTYVIELPFYNVILAGTNLSF